MHAHSCPSVHPSLANFSVHLLREMTGNAQPWFWGHGYLVHFLAILTHFKICTNISCNSAWRKGVLSQ